MSADAATNVQTADAPEETLRRTVLQHAASSIPGREIVQTLIEMPAGVASSWHIHPGEEVGYVIAGTADLEIHGRPARVLRAGDPFLVPPRTPHNVRSRDPEPARMLSTYLVETGQPVATFVK